MNLASLIERMIAAGVSPGEAGAIAAEIFASGVASASTRSAGAERTRRWRGKQASQSDGLRHQTSRGDAVTETSPNVTERHKPSQSDASTVLPIDTTIKNSKRQNSERPSRGTRIAPDWKPNQADWQIATDEGFSPPEIEREALRFRDYWTSRAGSGGVKLDWSATWRNWVRTSGEKLGKTPVALGLSAAEQGFYAKADSAERQAWDEFGIRTKGKSFPRDKNGGWRFPSQWPPGYVPSEGWRDPPPISIRSMQ